ncbi:MAG: hypothetical protein Q4E02_00840 [Lagierella massiliensis]|nr:hypothetical protein [Lagierella massiliensis]
MFDVVGDKKNYHNIQYNTNKKELDKVSKIVQKAENTGYNISKEYNEHIGIISLDLQLFAAKDIKNQAPKSLRKGIKSYKNK